MLSEAQTDTVATLPPNQGITRCDMIAESIIGAAQEMTLAVPLVVRLQGTNSAQGLKLVSGLCNCQCTKVRSRTSRLVSEDKHPLPFPLPLVTHRTSLSESLFMTGD